jgi:hypothetical protein
MYILQVQGGPVITPGTGFPFHCLLDLQGYSGGIRTRLRVGLELSKFVRNLFVVSSLTYEAWVSFHNPVSLQK